MADDQKATGGSRAHSASKCLMSSLLVLLPLRMKRQACLENLLQISRGKYYDKMCSNISGNIQGQVQWGSRQPRAEDVTAHCREIGLGEFKGPFQPKTFYHSYEHIFCICCLNISTHCKELHYR